MPAAPQEPARASAPPASLLSSQLQVMVPVQPVSEAKELALALLGICLTSAQTTLTIREGTGYGCALASFIPIHAANEDAEMLQAPPALRHYEAALTAQVGGLATVVEIAAEQTRREALCITYRRQADRICLYMMIRLLLLRSLARCTFSALARDI